MDRDKIKQTLIEAISEFGDIPPFEIEMDKTLKELALDSLEAVEVVLKVEGELDMAIPDGAYSLDMTVGNIVDAIAEKGTPNESARATRRP